ncbi:MAG: hypothetical protein ACLP5V_05200 [Candidatus Bathyarchaeia archaeon]
MAFDILLTGVNLLSVIATAALVFLTGKPCRESRVPYLLAIPAGFALMTVAFIVQVLEPLLVSSSSLLGLPVIALSLLTQAYGILFIALAYARRTGLRLLGQSTFADLLAAVLVTAGLFGIIFATQAFDLSIVPLSAELFLRAVIIGATLYLMYETLRNWSLTHRASEGFASIGFTFLLVEQFGFTLALANLGSVAAFLAYEGRLLGLFVLIAVLVVGVKKGDLLIQLKRLGLGAPAHTRATPLMVQQ